MNVWIVGDAFGFPNGYGATARVLAYARGLQAGQAAVRVVCLKAFERPGNGILNGEPRGIHDGIPFEYTPGTTVRGATFLRRRYLEIKGAAGLLRSVMTRGRRERLDAIIVYSSYSLFWTTLVWLAARLAGARAILEVCELPFVDRARTWSIRLQLGVLTRGLFRLFDGFIVISRYLEEYVLKHRPGAKLLRVPILVDADRFATPDTGIENHPPTVLFSGNLIQNGEIAGLLQAVGKLAAEGVDVRLQLVGDSGPAARAGIESEAGRLGLRDRVEFTGAVSQDRLPATLGSADVFVLPRKRGSFSDAGFPTKLGEYLAAGKPVVVTTTGEIPDHLQDGVSAFLAPPDDVDAFAARLRHVLDHPDLARRVGLCGRQVAIDRFDHRTHGKRLLAFVESLG